MDSSALKSEINRLKKDYFFNFNETATTSLRDQIDFKAGRLSSCGDYLFISKSSDSGKVLKIDKSFNVTAEYSLGKPLFIFSLVSYGTDQFIAVDGKTGRIYLINNNFTEMSDFTSQVAELKDKLIVCAEPDDKGGIYFAEKSSGNVYYLDKNKKISVFSTHARLPYFMSYFKNTLYIADMFLILIAREFDNIYSLKDGKSERTSLTGESLAYCKDIDSVFVSNYILSWSIAKYTSGLDRKFVKLINHDENGIQPFAIEIFANHLICIDCTTLKPVVFDIY
ncbi:hypothetical protein J7L67_01205 [bacterium]|nr:hypothetical protein [bacterium]